MAGKPGRSGGWNRLSVEAHRLRGTRPSWGALAAAQAPGDVSPAVMPDGLLDGLQTRGKAFVVACWTQLSNWNPATLVLLREAAMLVDQVEARRGQPEERSAQRLLLAVIQALRLAG